MDSVNHAEKAIAEAISNRSDTLHLYGGYESEPVPSTILQIPELHHLLLYGYADIPEWITEISTLESLEIEEARSCQAIVNNLWKLPRLKELKLAYGDIDALPDSIATLTSLEDLNLDGADFLQFPSVISQMTKLQSLSLVSCFCDLTEVFNTLATLPNLKKLFFSHLADDATDTLPPSFCQLQSIEELHFNKWEELQSIPECIGNLQNLRVLRLSNDDCDDFLAHIKELPESLGNLEQLEELDVYGLQDLKKFPDSFHRLDRLKILDTSKSGITELLLTPQQWNNLEELHAHGSLPDLRNCPNLKKFSWYAGGVSVLFSKVVRGIDFPLSLPHIEALKNLESLRLSGGRLESTAFLMSLPQLRKLHLSCDFDSLPDDINQLIDLEEIDIFGAVSLTQIPAGIARLPALKRISLRGCGISSLPESLNNECNITVKIDFINTQKEH